MDIHDPSIPQTTSAAAATDNAAPTTRESVLALIHQKDAIESELKALGSVLDSHKVTMKTSLTTFDGFPRDDVDIAQIRTTRTRIICLRNDYNALMKRIEAGLHELHAANAPDDADEEKSEHKERVLETPFAKVNSVAKGGPAEEAGLEVGDYVTRFGDADALNHENLGRIPKIVSDNEGKPIQVRLLQKGQETIVWIVPRQGWGGRGMLGCHLLPL